MKLIPVAVVLIFTIEVIVAVVSDDGSLESHDVQSGEVNANISVTLNDRLLANKTKKFVVSLQKPTERSLQSPKREGLRNNRVPKFQKQYNVPRGNNFPVSTRRPQLMQAKKFTSKPHVIDYAEELIERSNFDNKRTHNKFKTEEKGKIIEKKHYKTKNSENFKNRFRNFTDIDISNENDSDEAKETKKPLHRRYMKTAASNNVKAIALPSFANYNSQRNKIKDLLKTQKHISNGKIKMVPVLALQQDNGSTIGYQNNNKVLVQSYIAELSSKKGDISPEENADQNEFIFVKEEKRNKSTTESPDEEIVTSDPVNAK